MIYLIGGSGFLGSHLAQHMEEQNVNFEYISKNELFGKKKYETAERIIDAFRPRSNTVILNFGFDYSSNNNSKIIQSSIVDFISFISIKIPTIEVLHVNSELQRASPLWDLLKANGYLNQKRWDYRVLRNNVKNLIVLEVASAISDKRNSKSGLDLYLKKIKNSVPGRFVVCPNIFVKIQKAEDIAYITMKNAAQFGGLEQIVPKSYVVNLPKLVKIINPNVKIFPLPIALLIPLALGLSIFSKIFNKEASFGLERIGYYFWLKKYILELHSSDEVYLEIATYLSCDKE